MPSSSSLVTLAIRVATIGIFLATAFLMLAVSLGRTALSDEIAFVSGRLGDFEVFVMDIQRGFVANLSRDSGFDFNPAWSPDGSLIAFESSRDGEFGIWVTDASGHNARRLISGRGGAPAWSPDGAQVVFASERDGNYEIYTANVDGSDIRRLTFDKASDFNPAWSPDGSRILFQSDRGPDYGFSIYTMDTNGHHLHRLSDKAAIALDPAWSPDGASIVFMSTQSGGKNLFVMDADETNVYPLTSPSGIYDGSPAWSPDGERIAFDSDRYRNGYSYGWGIYLMNVGGSDARLLTEGVRPAWRPG